MGDFDDDNFMSHRQPPVDVGGDDEEASPQVESSTHDFDLVETDHLEDAKPSGDPYQTEQSCYSEYDDMATLPPAAAPNYHEPGYEPPVLEEPEPEPEPESSEPLQEPQPSHIDEPPEKEEEPSSPSTPACRTSGCVVVAFLTKIYFHEKVQHVLLWRNIGLTVGVLVLFLYTAFSIALLSFLSVVGYYGLAIIVCTFAIRLYRDILAAIGKQQAANFFILEMVDHAAEADWSVSKDCVMSAVSKACDVVNHVANDVRDVIVVRSYARTIKAVVGLYFLTWIGGCFNLLTLVILVVLNLFYIPLLLVKFDKEINAFVLQIHGHIQQGIDVVRQKAPFLANFFDSKQKTA